MQQDKKHKESRADCVDQNYIRGTDEVCSVREGVVCDQGPATNLTGSDPFRAAAGLLMRNGTGESYVGRRPSCGMQQMNTYSSSICYLRRRQPFAVPWR